MVSRKSGNGQVQRFRPVPLKFRGGGMSEMGLREGRCSKIGEGSEVRCEEWPLLASIDEP